MSSKKKNFKTTWIVVIVFVVLGAVSVYVDSQDKINRGKIKIFNVSKEDIKSFELINNKTGETVACEKYGGSSWGMIKPRVYEIEKSEVEMVVNNLAALTIDRKVEKPEPLANYGLENQDFTASFVLNNGKKHSLLIGSKNPTGTFFYIKSKDSKDVYIGFGFSMEAVMKGVKDLRKKSFFDVNTENVVRVDFKYELREFSLAKGEDKKWSVQPYNFPGNKEETETLLNTLKEVKAIDFMEDDAKDLKKYGLDRPRLSLTVTATGKPITVQIGKKSLSGNEDYARIDGSGVIYTVSADFLKSTDRNYNDFRSKKLFSLIDEEFNELEISCGKTTYLAARDKNNKFVLKGKAGPEVALANLVRTFLSQNAESFIDDSGKRFEKYGLKNPKYTLSAYENAGGARKVKVKLLVGEEKGKNESYVRVEPGESVFVIGKELVERINEVIKAAETK